MKLFRKLFFVISAVIFLATFQPVLAQSPESFGLTPQRTLPGSTAYVFKRLKEKGVGFFKFSKDSKLAFRSWLLERRISEFVSIVESKNLNEITNASQRIAYEAGTLAGIAESKETKEQVTLLFDKYQPVLAKMRDNFPANTPGWLLSQQDIDTLNILSKKLK